MRNMSKLQLFCCLVSLQQWGIGPNLRDQTQTLRHWETEHSKERKDQPQLCIGTDSNSGSCVVCSSPFIYHCLSKKENSSRGFNKSSSSTTGKSFINTVNEIVTFIFCISVPDVNFIHNKRRHYDSYLISPVLDSCRMSWSFRLNWSACSHVLYDVTGHTGSDVF